MATKKKKVAVPSEVLELTETPQDAPEQALIPKSSELIVKPMISPAQAKENWKSYIELCNAILEPSDFTRMVSYQAGKGSVVKLFKNKSAWRKLSTAFNLSSEVLKEERHDFPSYFVVQITARIHAPNGRFVDGTGTCASNERKFAHTEHDVRAMAETRAKSRAISDMIGGGEVTAEEMMQMEESKKNQCPQDHSKLPQKTVATEGKNKGRPYHKCSKCTYFEWLDEPKIENVSEEVKE